MVEYSSGVFKVTLLTPDANLLDCRAGSLILPGYDGQFGILRNHAPMLCKLGMGIMQVRNIVGRNDAFFLINGGFTRVSENNVTVLAYEVTTFEGVDREQAEKIIAQAKSVVVGKAYIRSQIEAMDHEKAAMLVKLGRYSALTD